MDTKEFFDAYGTDAEMQKKFMEVESKEQFYELAKENGLTDDLETFVASATAMVEGYKTEIGEEELELDSAAMADIAGGSDSAAYGGFIAGI